MKILYVILTCEKNKQRQQWQRETWLMDIKDFVYLDEPIGEEIYNNAPLKYVQFLKNWDPDKVFDVYDWFFFCDDDTFVYTDKLNELLIAYTPLRPRISNFDYDAIVYKPIMIGFSGGTFPIYNLRIQWCSGGAGIALSRECIKNIQIHLRSTPRPLVTHETDISLAIWATMANENLTVVDNRRFSPFNPRDAEIEKLHDCITYHYCTQEDFYSLYSKR